MFVFDPGRHGRPVRRRGVGTESSLLLGTEMFRTIGGGHDFDVGKGRLCALVKLVMNASVWNFNFVIDKWQVEALGHFLLDLVDIALRFRLPSSVNFLVDVSLEFAIALSAGIRSPGPLD